MRQCAAARLSRRNAAALLAVVRQVDVANRGFGGYNSRWGLKLLQQVLAQSDARRVALLTIWFGANDAALPDRSA